MQWLFISVAIACEVIATSALKSSDGFTRLWPSVVSVSGYLSAFYFLSITLRTLPVGIAYAVGRRVGIMLIALVAWLLHGQALDTSAILGLVLIVACVSILSVFFRSNVH